jgi:hypothetical protein
MIRVTIFLLFFCFACRAKKDIANNKSAVISMASLREKYKVVRIDSIQTVYVVYARKDNEVFKIVSVKDSIPCKQIRVGEEHALVLMSRVPKNFNGMDVSPATVPHLTGISVNGVDIRFEPDSIKDIFLAVNLHGLCMQ